MKPPCETPHLLFTLAARLRPTVCALVGATLLTSTAGSVALATPISLLTVSGPGNTGQTISVDQGAAVSFTFDQSYTDVAISADLVCIACDGALYLMNGAIGPAATVANLVTGAFFDVGSSVDPLLSGLSLDAGEYFLIVAITTAGGAAWVGSDPFVFTAAPGVGMGLNYFADDLDNAVPFRSEFLPIASPAGLHVSVVGNAASVPEPATSIPLALGLGVLAAHRYRRSGARGWHRHRMRLAGQKTHRATLNREVR